MATPSVPIRSGRSILRDFARLMMLTVMLPVLILGGLAVWKSATTAREQFGMRLASAAEVTGRDIERFLQMHTVALQMLAEHRSAASNAQDPSAWRADLERTRRYFPDFNSLAVIGPTGQVRMRYPALPGATGAWVADRSYFSQPQRTGQVHVSNAFAGRLEKGTVPSIVVSAPYYMDGRFAGVVGGAIRLDTFPALRHPPQQVRNLELLLLDRDFTVVHATPGLPYRPLDVLRHTHRDRLLRAVTPHEPAQMQRVPGVLHDGGDAYAAMVPLKVGWRLLVLVPDRAVVSELRRSALVIFGLLVLVLLGMLAISGMQLRRLGGFVRALLERMQRFALDIATPPAAPDSLPQELAPLAEALNQLAARARVAYGEVTESLQEQQRLREELQAVARRLLTAQEDERNALSRELHDDIGQQITAIKLSAMALRNDSDPEQRDEILTEIVSIADQTIARLRNLSLLLRPPQLDSVGIEAALRWHAETVFRAGRPRLELSLASLPRRPDPEVELACFRIAQEALTNILRHSHAHQVTLILEPCQDGQALSLVIADDGIGFDTTRVHGLGLLTMRERAQQLGGTVHIDTGPERGTCVRVTLPVHRPR